jgi:hypothetical protein
MKLIDLRNDTKDLDLTQRFKAMIEASPRYNIDFKWANVDVDEDIDPDCSFILSDRTPEEECPENEHYLLRKDIAEEPRKVIWNMIKYLPSLYCLDYGSLYLEKITL